MLHVKYKENYTQTKQKHLCEARPQNKVVKKISVHFVSYKQSGYE